MMTKYRRIEPVLSRTPGGYRPAHTSAAYSSVQPYDARVPDVVDPAYETSSAVPKATPKTVKAGRFKQRAFERTPYVIPQADLEVAAAHIAQAGDESHAGHTGDAPKRKTYLCRGIFVILFGIWVMGALSVGAFEIAAVFALLVALSTRIGPDIAGSKFKHDFKPIRSYEDMFGKRSCPASDPGWRSLYNNMYHHSRY